MKLHYFIKYLLLSVLSQESWGAYTAIVIGKYTDKITEFTPSLPSKSTLKSRLKRRSYGITYDVRSGKFLAITGSEAGNQELIELCGSAKVPMTSLSPNKAVLTCLSAGPSGVYALNSVSAKYGKIDIVTGKWSALASIPVNENSNDSFVFAQDNNGMLHFINGKGDYYTSPANQNKFTLVENGYFPTDIQGFCGDFDESSSNNNIIIAANPSGVIEFDIAARTTVLQTLKENLHDVTNGPLNKACPSTDLTGVSFFPNENVYSLSNTLSTTTKRQLELPKNIGMTYDQGSGKYYAILGYSAGSHKLVEVCNESYQVIASISPNDVQLNCLTSGPKGLYSIDINRGEFGEISLKTGKFSSIGSLPMPYDNGYAFAQDQQGDVHYINGDGAYYVKHRNTMNLQKISLSSPTADDDTVLSGICGEFDGSDLVAASMEKGGGIVRYSFHKQTAIRIQANSNVYYNDVTHGPFHSTSHCPSTVFTGAAFGPRNVLVNINYYTSIATNNRAMEENLGITYHDTTKKFYGIEGHKAGSQQLVGICKNTITPIAPISPTSVQISCITAGPKGLYALDITTARFGIINTQTGNWRKVGSLPGPYSSHVFAQNSQGVLSYVNGDGKYFTNFNQNTKLKHVQGVFFPTDYHAICGDFDGNDDIVAAAYYPHLGTVRYNIPRKTTTLKKLSPATFLNDVTAHIIDDDVVCPTTSPLKSDGIISV